MKEQIIEVLVDMGYSRIHNDAENCIVYAKGKGTDFDFESYVTFEDEIIIFEDEASRREFTLEGFNLESLKEGF